MNWLDNLSDCIYGILLVAGVIYWIYRRLSPGFERTERDKEVKEGLQGKGPVLGQVIARSVDGEVVEEVGDQLWLVKPDGARDQVTDEWLDQAIKSSAWRDMYEEGMESAFPSPEEREEIEEIAGHIEPLPKEVEEAGMPMPWESEIASDLSFYDRITPDMLTHVPKEQRVAALQEYAWLHPEEAYWDGEALVRKGKDEPESRG